MGHAGAPRPHPYHTHLTWGDTGRPLTQGEHAVVRARANVHGERAHGITKPFTVVYQGKFAAAELAYVQDATLPL